MKWPAKELNEFVVEWVDLIRPTTGVSRIAAKLLAREMRLR